MCPKVSNHCRDAPHRSEEARARAANEGGALGLLSRWEAGSRTFTDRECCTWTSNPRTSSSMFRTFPPARSKSGTLDSRCVAATLWPESRRPLRPRVALRLSPLREEAAGDFDRSGLCPHY
eukprot:6509865-Pyramimonas_sp.AAC.2